MSKKTSETRNEYEFKFSFVMALYNSEDFLTETLESVIHQTLSFTDNVQVILVNDGSTDDSGDICEMYRQRFPENIIYIEQKNKGVSAARNAGIGKASGEYTSFLDSDDKISLNTLQKVNDFFAKNEHKTDVACIKFEFFGTRSGGHPLNYKFKTTRVVDLVKEYDHIQLSASSAFIRTDSFRGKHFFDESIRYYEDVKFMVDVLASRMTLGVVSEPIYYYRRRDSADSAVNLSRERSDFYTKTLKSAHAYILKYAKSDTCKLSRYAQYIVMYDLQFRFKQVEQDTLNPKQELEYKRTLVKLLQSIDDDIILQQRNIYGDTKLFILGKKHGENVWEKAEQIGYDYTYKGNVVYSYSTLQKIHISNIAAEGDTVALHGIMRGQLMAGVKFGFMVDEIFHEAVKEVDNSQSRMFLGEVYFIKNSFTSKLPIRHETSIVPVINIPDNIIKRIPYNFGNSMPELRYYQGASHLIGGSYIICRVSPEEIIFVKNSLMRRLVKKRRLSRTYHEHEANTGMPKEYKAVEK